MPGRQEGQLWRTDAIAVGLLALLTAALAVAPASVLLGRREQAKQDADELTVQQKQLRALDDELNALTAQLTAVEEAMGAQSVRLDPPDAVNTRLAVLSELASGCGLQIDKLRPGRPIPNQHYQTVPLHVAGVGSYRQCAVFLRQVKAAMPDTSAQTFALAGNGLNPLQPGTFTFVLQWIAAASASLAPVIAP